MKRQKQSHPVSRRSSSQRPIYILLLLLISLFLTGCSFFDDTYLIESDYTLPDRKESGSRDTVTVTEFADLCEAIRNTVAAGASERTIVFDNAYTGNPTEDLASGCWQVRTGDALCAYCVENIAYEMTQIVSRTEAKLKVSYSSGALPVDEIISMPYATELNDRIAEAISSGRSRLAILINRSILTSESMALRFSEVYRANPGLAPQEPHVSVSLFSGSGSQRLYEITLKNDLSEREFLREKAELDAIVFPPEEEPDEYSIALDAYEYLSACCDAFGPPTVYAALVEKDASSEGIALGFVELCRRGGLECMLVDGQKDWEDHCWNIVRIDGKYYHVDLFAGMEKGFLKSDADFWGSYRWTVNEYPVCEVDFFAKEEETDSSTPDPTEESIPPEETAAEESISPEVIPEEH